MRQVWLLARRAFTFKGKTYQEGQRFQADQLAAIEMIAMRAVYYAKKPPEPAPTPVVEAPPPARRRYARPMQAALSTTTAALTVPVEATPDATAPETLAPIQEATPTPEA